MLRLALLLCLFCAGLPQGLIAAMVPLGAAPAGAAVLARPLFPPVSEPWQRSFQAFADWLRTPDGRVALQYEPSLARYKALDFLPEAGRTALSPIVERLAAERPAEAALRRVGGVAALSAEERARVLADVARAGREAAPAIEARAAEALEALNALPEPELETLRALTRQLKELSIHSLAVRKSYRNVRRRATERAMRSAQTGARSLLEGLDWDSGDLVPAEELPVLAKAESPPRAPVAGLTRPKALPPSDFYDAGHWTPSLIPDRGYARRLDAAAKLFAGADKAESERASRASSARRDLAATMRDAAPRIYSHMMRVGLLAGLIAWRMGFSMDSSLSVGWGARIHDIGKRRPEILAVVNKEGALSPEERAVMQTHTSAGAEIIDQDAGLDHRSRRVGRKVALTHHESMDGAGYPNRLLAEDIPVESRITAIADVYDALMEHRPYRRALASSEALKIMSEIKRRFDPAAWGAFLSIVAGADAPPGA